MQRLLRAVFAVLLVLPSLAFAHPGHDGPHDFEWDFSNGFAHPLTGLDHLLAMVAIGLWAGQLGGRARWLIPGAFVGIMTLGAVLARAGAVIPGVEQMIAASVVVLGLLIATAARLPLAAGMGVAALFALFHGFAHGAEMPATAATLSFGAGFVLATVLLHAAGLGFGWLAARRLPARTANFAGWTVAVCGAVLIAC